MTILRRPLLLAVLVGSALLAGPPSVTGPAQGLAAAPTLRVFVTGNGTVSGSGLNCGAKGTACSASYAPGTTVTITAAAEPFSVFAGWTGACTGTGSTCTLEAGDPQVVTAIFNYVEVVDVAKQGEGRGRVVSRPAGIDCGAVCSAPFTGNTKVTLVAKAARGSVFAGWSGYCKGRSATCTLQQTYGSMPVVAQFEPKGRSGTYTRPSSSSAFTASALDASAERTASGRVITVRFAASKAAAVRVQVWKDKKLISQARLEASPGRVTVKLPFADGYPAGVYDLKAYLDTPGGKTKLLHWKVTVPA